MKCRNCGDVVDPRRVESGYDYCLKEECQRRCLQRVELAAVGVNKAADYYMRADEVLPPPAPPAPPQPGAASLDVDEPGRDRPGTPRPAVGRTRRARAKSTLERLREQEAALDKGLDQAYERFRVGEITAREMDSERDRLVDAFNRQVMSENIRYRSFLRRSPHRGAGGGKS